MLLYLHVRLLTLMFYNSQIVGFEYVCALFLIEKKKSYTYVCINLRDIV